jgi:hypothetical protein
MALGRSDRLAAAPAAAFVPDITRGSLPARLRLPPAGGGWRGGRPCLSFVGGSCSSCRFAGHRGGLSEGVSGNGRPGAHSNVTEWRVAGQFQPGRPAASSGRGGSQAAALAWPFDEPGGEHLELTPLDQGSYTFVGVAGFPLPRGRQQAGHARQGPLRISGCRGFCCNAFAPPDLGRQNRKRSLRCPSGVSRRRACGDERPRAGDVRFAPCSVDRPYPSTHSA